MWLPFLYPAFEELFQAHPATPVLIAYLAGIMLFIAVYMWTTLRNTRILLAPSQPGASSPLTVWIPLTVLIVMSLLLTPGYGKDWFDVFILTSACAACRIIILTTFGRPGYLRQAMQSGVVGFLLKEAPSAQLATAIRRVTAGERVVDPKLAMAAHSEGNNPLTEREREVLATATRGASIAEIATSLFLSEGTVRNYLSVAIQKLDAHNRIEAAHIAEQKGWL